MTESIQCDNCGAVLLKEDLFCGECGAPRPVEREPGEPPSAEEPVAPVSPAPPPARPAPSAEVGWRVAFIVLVVLAAIACLAGLASFLLFGSVGGETTTPEEDWLYSAICCLLPIGGTGALLAAIGGGIWYTRLKKR